MPTRGARGPWLWPLGLAVIGVILLLNNFLLLGDFNVGNLWPLLLVALGAAVLLRGDFVPSSDARTFGITRGSVESATLEINAAEIDVVIRSLQHEGRLIAGQYAISSRPALRVSDTHAHLKMDRAGTPWLSFADWELGLAQDLPWQLYVSTSLGQANLNLSGLIVQETSISTGFGDIRLVCPNEALGAIRLRSALGNIHVVSPIGCAARVHVSGSRLLSVHIDEHRYEQIEPQVYLARDAQAGAPEMEIYISGTFGNVYLT